MENERFSHSGAWEGEAGRGVVAYGAMRTHAAVAASMVCFTGLTAAVATPLHAQGPKTHRLEATPSTVAYGYYWSEAKPALRIASGDVIDVDTLLTNTPAGLQRAGVPEDKIQSSLQAIVT